MYLKLVTPNATEMTVEQSATENLKATEHEATDKSQRRGNDHTCTWIKHTHV